MDLVQQSEDVPKPYSLFRESSLESRENKQLKKKKKKKKRCYSTINYDIYATPLVEIYSVSIHTNWGLNGLEKCEIYGRISVVDKSGYTFDLFNQAKEDAEGVNNDDTLLLSFPSWDENEGSLNVIRPSKHVSLDVELFDKAHNDMLIANGCFQLDRTVADCKAKQFSKQIDGDVGFAKVHYAEFPYAVVAFVEVLYFSPNDDFDSLSDEDDSDSQQESFDEVDNVDYDNHKCDSDFAVLYGTIIARNDLLKSDGSDREDFKSSVLFRKPREDSVLVNCGDFIELSRTTVNVPVSSSLKIEVDFSDRGTRLEVARKTLEFKPQHSETYKKDIVGRGRIRVLVTWYDAYTHLNKEWNVKQRPESSTSHVFSSVPLHILDGSYKRTPMVEVFSIAVCGKDFQPFSYYGGIHINAGDFWIFKSDLNSLRYCPASGTHVELNCHDIYSLADNFSIYVGLEDAYNSVISEGLLLWLRYTDRKWFNRPLCSIIRGDRGFTAVHYAIFSDAFSATLYVKLNGNFTTSRVSGKLLAYYDNISGFYSSSYEKKYYRSVIFQKDAEEEDLPLLSSGMRIPLLKSVIMVPNFSSLKFDADLSVCPVPEEGNGSRKEVKLVQGQISFDAIPDREYHPGTISGQDVHIDIFCKFEWW